MLNNYTWSDYLTAAALLIAVYYLAIAGLFYRTEIKNLLSGKIKFRKQNISDGYTAPGEMEEADFDELEVVLAGLKNSISEQADTEVSKDQLLAQLKQRLTSYGGLRREVFRDAVNNAIISDAQQKCGVVFSEGELDAAWKTLPR